VELAEQLRHTPLAEADLLDPPTGPARFLALRHPKAPEWQAGLMAQDCITDVRADVLRIGLGLYHDAEDVERFAALAEGLG
jgi:selenocysteine lyase/cysteine desulfurase